MEGEQQKDYSVTIPLLLNVNHKNGTKAEEQNPTPTAVVTADVTTGTSSFFNTCFNGLNALSACIDATLDPLIAHLAVGIKTAAELWKVIEETFFEQDFAEKSHLKTLLQLLEQGVGILSVPYALASGGWLSLILLFTIAILTFYTGILIKRCMDTDHTIRSYPDIGYRAFGRTGRIIVSVTMNIELYLVATGFLILEGDNLSNLLQEVEFDLYGIHIDSKKSFVIIVAAIILPTIWLNNLSILSYISASGVLASLLIVGSILWVGEFDGVRFQEKGEIIKWKGIPSAISLYAFCYCAHPVFPTLYTSMRNRQQFSKVLLLCFVFCTITYSSMAVVGYLMFGSEMESQITLNLPTDKISSRVAICTTVMNPIAKYALMMTPIVHTIEERFLSVYNTRNFSLIIRTTLVISTVVVALTLPFFGYLMSLVGAFLSVTASIILPSLCYLKISGTYRRFGLELVLIGFIVLIGILVAIVGTYTSLADIARNI